MPIIRKASATFTAVPTRKPTHAAIPTPAALVLFGLHPCDLAAIAYQDRFFARDPYYRARRARAVLVGVNCLDVCGGGFCRDVDAGPFARIGFDLALTRLPDGRVVVESGGSVGDAALARIGSATATLDVAARAARDRAERAAVATYLRWYRAYATARWGAVDPPGDIERALAYWTEDPPADPDAG